MIDKFPILPDLCRCGDRHDLLHRLLLPSAASGHGFLRPSDLVSLVVPPTSGHLQDESGGTLLHGQFLSLNSRFDFDSCDICYFLKMSALHCYFYF